MTRARPERVPPGRPAPSRWTLIGPGGTERVFDVVTATLLVAVKPDCDGCATFYDGDLSPLESFDVVLVATTEDGAAALAGSRHSVVSAGALLGQLGVRWAPFYVLVEPDPPRVVAEGLAFDPGQVADEIRRARGL